MNASLFIARRYLLSKHAFNFITVITAISIAGITVGVAALIIILSVFNGFQSLVERFLVGFDPHLRITSVAENGKKSQNAPWITNADSLAALAAQALQPLKAEGLPVNAAAVAGGKIIALKTTAHATAMLPCKLYGIDQNSVEAVSGLRASLAAGAFETSERDGAARVVMGILLADKLRLSLGDTITLVSAAAIEDAVAQAAFPRLTRAVLAGVFQSNNKEYDAFSLYASLGAARRLLDIPPQAALSIDIRCGSAARGEQAQKLVQAALGNGFRVETWYDLHRDLYNVMRFERLAAFIVLSIIVFVAVFNIFASLSMSVAEKRPEIGMLKAMGATPRFVRQIFIAQGALVGALGTALGAALGLALCWGQQQYGWFALDTSRYLLAAIPVVIDWSDTVLVCLFALSLSLIAGVIPARRAGDERSAVLLLRKERL